MQIIEMPREKYEEIYKPKLVEAYRSVDFAINEGVNLEITEDDVTCEEIFLEEYYNYSTGKLIEE